ncbi:hypothetical protein CHISP_0703 [Chitinispirillum alkaliphilum]|nr:hypothetical protein CHISP_0703 [Chitinispirillum alkaliphilum]
MKEVYHRTKILRKPISGIVSGYHDLSYKLIVPDDDNPSHTIEVNGKINVSPKFIISADSLQDTYGDVFDPDTFDSNIEGRLFSFAYAKKRNINIKSEYFRIERFEEMPQEHADRIEDQMAMREDTRTGLITGTDFNYYPVSIDKFISEILDSEFRV